MNNATTQARLTALIEQRAGIPTGQARLTDPDAPWSLDDRMWFAMHPTRMHRMRDAFPGEFDARRLKPIPDGYVLKVLVRQVEPGLRARVPWGRLKGAPDDVPDEVVHVFFDYAHAQPGKTPDAADLAELQRSSLALAGAGRKQ